MTTLTKAPIIYEPTITNGIFIDNISKYKWNDFGECGFTCPCSKIKTIHRNKSSFMYQHCKTKSHKDYIEMLNRQELTEPHTNTNGIQKELKLIKIQLVKEHELFQLEKQKNKNLLTQITDIVVQKNEIESEVKQSQTFIEEILKEKIAMREKIEKYEKILEQMMLVAGYEVEITQ
jgi:hypothetical protein